MAPTTLKYVLHLVVALPQSVSQTDGFYPQRDVLSHELRQRAQAERLQWWLPHLIKVRSVPPAPLYHARLVFAFQKYSARQIRLHGPEPDPFALEITQQSLLIVAKQPKGGVLLDDPLLFPFLYVHRYCPFLSFLDWTRVYSMNKLMHLNQSAPQRYWRRHKR